MTKEEKEIRKIEESLDEKRVEVNNIEDDVWAILEGKIIPTISEITLFRRYLIKVNNEIFHTKIFLYSTITPKVEILCRRLQQCITTIENVIEGKYSPEYINWEWKEDKLYNPFRK